MSLRDDCTDTVLGNLSLVGDGESHGVTESRRGEEMEYVFGML